MGENTPHNRAVSMIRCASQMRCSIRSPQLPFLWFRKRRIGEAVALSNVGTLISYVGFDIGFGVSVIFLFFAGL